MNQDKLGFLSTYQGQTRTNTDEHQQTTISYQIGTLLKISKKIWHAEIFSHINFGCRFASRMNWDTLGWSG